MKNYVLYLESGQIVGYGNCMDDVFDTLPAEGQLILEAYCTEYQYVKNGIVVDMPPKPVGEYVFDYQTEQWIFDEQAATAIVLLKRDQLLANGPDRISPLWYNSMSQEEKDAWSTYRQNLLDITSQPNFPNDIIWPTKPTEGA